MTAMGSNSAIATGQPDSRNSMFPEGHLKVTGFFDQPDPEWYESVHAPDFLSFAAPHMARYARNWVKGVRLGDAPAFSVITEIQFASESAKQVVRGLMATPAAKPLLEHTIEQRAKLGIVEEMPPPGLGLFPVRPAPTEPPESAFSARRQVLLLRKADGADGVAFETVAGAVAAEIANSGSEVSSALDLVAPGQIFAPADALVYVSGAKDADLAVAGMPGLEVVAILDVETVASAVGNAR